MLLSDKACQQQLPGDIVHRHAIGFEYLEPQSAERQQPQRDVFGARPVAAGGACFARFVMIRHAAFLDERMRPVGIRAIAAHATEVACRTDRQHREHRIGDARDHREIDDRENVFLIGPRDMHEQREQL